MCKDAGDLFAIDFVLGAAERYNANVRRAGGGHVLLWQRLVWFRPMLSTRTGSFPIGFRRGWSDWQKDLPAVLAWSKSEELSVIDLGGGAAEAMSLVKDA